MYASAVDFLAGILRGFVDLSGPASHRGINMIFREKIGNIFRIFLFFSQFLKRT